MAVITRKIAVVAFSTLILVLGFILLELTIFGKIFQKEALTGSMTAIAHRYFTPDLPGLQPAVRFVVRGLSGDNNNVHWDLKISGKSGSTLRKLSGNQILESGIVWDGRDAKGILVQAATPCTAYLKLVESGKEPTTLTAKFKLGFALVQKVGRTTISNIPIVFSFKNTDSNREFFLSDAAYQRVKAFANAMAQNPEFDISVWAGKDRSIRRADKADKEALQRAAKVRRELIHLGMSPERISLDVIPISAGHLREYDIEFAIELPLLAVLSSENGRS